MCIARTLTAAIYALHLAIVSSSNLSLLIGQVVVDSGWRM